MNDDILFGIGIGVFGIIIATALICIVAPFLEKENLCAYCNSGITDTADVVCCSDGRKYHAECYLRYIEEGENGKTNSETP
jgi:hypothetical protein